jgi:hypothetical protein
VCALFPFLEVSLLETMKFRCCLGGGCIVVVRVVYRSGTFCSYFLFLLLCASVLPLGYCIVVEARCN